MRHGPSPDLDGAGRPRLASRRAFTGSYQQAFFYNRLGYAAAQSVVMLAIVTVIAAAIMGWSRHRGAAA